MELETNMSREYRIECSSDLNRTTALNILAESPYFHRPSLCFQNGEIWLSTVSRLDYADVRIIPQPYGFFIEVTNLPSELSKTLECWISQLHSLCVCSLVDNDTDEVVKILR
jgi:hypothetical protein